MDALKGIAPSLKRVKIVGEKAADIISPRCFVSDFEDPRLFRALRSMAYERVGSERSASLIVKKVNALPLENAVRGDVRDQAYALEIASGRIEITAETPIGAFYGLTTLRRLAETRRTLPCSRILDWPDMPVRGLHMCFHKGNRPRFDYLKRFVARLADYKLNALVIEYDDAFPWKNHPDIAGPDAYDEGQVRDLLRLADDNFMEVIPLVNAFGHAESYLKHARYAHLRDLPDNIHEMCPLNPETMAFTRGLWEELFAAHPNCRYAHIAGDEVFRSGERCPKCQAYADRDELARLYSKFYRELSQWIIAQGKTPMLWGDMLIKYPEDIDNFPKDIVICDWCYNNPDKPYWDRPLWLYRPDGKIPEERKRLLMPYVKETPESDKYIAFPYHKFFVDKGFKVIAATHAGQEKSLSPFPSAAATFANNKRFAARVKELGTMGLIATWWGIDPLELSAHGVVAAAEYSWSARDEGQDAFYERFSTDYFGLDAEPKQVVTRLDRSYFVQKDGFRKTRWPVRDNVAALSRDALELKAKARRGREYLDYLALLAEAGEDINALHEVFNAIDAAEIGEGDDVPIDLAPWANVGFNNFARAGADPLELDIGEVNALGVKFQVIDPRRNDGRALVCLRGQKKPEAPETVEGITVAAVYDRLFFLVAAYDAAPGACPGEIAVHLRDGSRHSLKLISGRNIADWSWRPGVTLDEDHLAFQRNHRAVYLVIWDNPTPPNEIAALDLLSSGEMAYFALVAATGRRSRKVVVCLDAAPAKILALSARLKERQETLKRLLEQDTYTKDAEETAKNSLIGHAIRQAEIYVAKIKGSAPCLK